MAPLRRLFSTVFDLPQDIFVDVPRVTIIGREELLIESPRGIISFSDTELTIELADGALRVTGENLSLRSVSSDEISVQGSIATVIFRGVGSHD